MTVVCFGIFPFANFRVANHLSEKCPCGYCVLKGSGEMVPVKLRPDMVVPQLCSALTLYHVYY